MLENRDGKKYIKARRQDVATILAALTKTTSVEETPVMATDQPIAVPPSGQAKLPHSSKRARPVFSVTVVCKDCGLEAPRTGTRQFFCAPCSDKRTLARKLKWVKKNPPTKEYVQRREKKKRSRLSERGAAVSERQRLGVESLFPHGIPKAWHVRLSVPFSYAGSKNHSCSISPHGHVYLRAQTKEYRQQVTDAVSAAVFGIKVATAKVWVDLIVQKPDHRGDAINVLDVVADGIKRGLGVDDRWFCISRLDWQIIKSDPCLLIGIGQDEAEDCRVCSYCGQIKPLQMLHANRGSPQGYSRCCKECFVKGTKAGTSKITPDTVRLIRSAAAEGTSAEELARHFGISPTTARQVINRKTWKEVE